MKSKPARHRSLRRGLWRAQDGAAAVEFGLVALPFLFMLFAVLEMALFFTLDSVLDNATVETGRLVRTGQVTSASMTPEQFQEELCNRMSIFADNCRAPNTTTIDVREVPQFDADIENPADDGELAAGETGFDPGGPGSLILVRVWYRQPIITAFLAPGEQDKARGYRLLSSTTAFRNEPA